MPSDVTRDLLIIHKASNGTMRACRQAGDDLRCVDNIDGDMRKRMRTASRSAETVDDIRAWARGDGYTFETDGTSLAIDGARPRACVTELDAATSIKSEAVQAVGNLIGNGVRAVGSHVTCRSDAEAASDALLAPAKSGVSISEGGRRACSLDDKGFLRCSKPDGTPMSATRDEFRLVKMSGYVSGVSGEVRPQLVDVSVCTDPSKHSAGSFARCVEMRERWEVDPLACRGGSSCMRGDGAMTK